MKSKFWKFGMTLAEVMVALGVVGIIAAVSFSAYKPKESARRYQIASAYKTIETAYYNGLMSGFNPFEGDGNAVVEYPNFPVPFRVQNNFRPNVLCWGLTKYINVIGGYANDVSVACNVGGLSPVEINTTLEGVRPAFIAQGTEMRFWISEMYSEQDPNVPKFFLVFVDVNGERGPNSLTYPDGPDGRELPDRVAFALFENGRITPIGPLEWDTRLLTARVVYYDENGNEAYSHPDYNNNSVAFFRAKARAWGFYNGGIADPINAGDMLDAHTYNDYVRSKLAVGNPLLDFMPALNTGDGVAAELRCNAADYGACFIYIDQYKW